MFSIGWPELLLVMVVALVVIGPKELPAAIRTVTLVMRKMRAMAREFQSGLDDIAREAGIDDIKREFDDVTSYDPKAALDNIAGIDDRDFSFDDDPAAATGNTIRDPGAEPAPAEDDPDLLVVPEQGAAKEPVQAERPAGDASSEEPAPADGDDAPARRPASGSR